MGRIVALVSLCCLSSFGYGRMYEPCDLADELLKLGAPQDQISTWVCIAEHESTYNTSAVGPSNWDGSRDHGIFQINDRYWCSPPGSACGVACHSLEDNDISDDWKCAKRIFKATRLQEGNGFRAWAVYGRHCSGDTSSYVAGCHSTKDHPSKQVFHSYILPSYGLPVFVQAPWHRILGSNVYGGVPIVLSFPHFYRADSSYQDAVEGLSPNMDSHQTYVDLEPTTGVPVQAAKRIQLNFQMKGSPALKITGKARDLLLPFIWIDETVELEGAPLSLIKNQLLKMLKIANIIRWVVIAAGLLMLLVGSLMAYLSAKAEHRHPD